MKANTSEIVVKTFCNGDCRLEAVDAQEYRGHEICLHYCKTCNTWTADIRADNFDGEFIEGYTEYPSIIELLKKCFDVIDKHEYELTLSARREQK